MNSFSCVITGHRPTRFKFKYNEKDKRCQRIKKMCIRDKVETLQLQERLHIRKTKRIQEELIRVPNFAALYGALCRQEIGDEEIASVLESADGYGERLTAYSQEQVLAVMKLELLPSLRLSLIHI